MSNTPTPAAMRAAEAIDLHTEGRLCDYSDETIARIIDRETGLAELVEACQSWLDWAAQLDAEATPGDPLIEIRRRTHAKRLDKCRQALSRHQPKDQTNASTRPH